MRYKCPGFEAIYDSSIRVSAIFGHDLPRYVRRLNNLPGSSQRQITAVRSIPLNRIAVKCFLLFTSCQVILHRLGILKSW